MGHPGLEAVKARTWLGSWMGRTPKLCGQNGCQEGGRQIRLRPLELY